MPNSHLFLLNEEEIDSAKDVAFHIEMTPGEPIQQRLRHLSQGTLSAVREEIRKLLLMQRIARASGEWASPIVVVRQLGETKV